VKIFQRKLFSPEKILTYMAQTALNIIGTTAETKSKFFPKYNKLTLCPIISDNFEGGKLCNAGVI